MSVLVGCSKSYDGRDGKGYGMEEDNCKREERIGTMFKGMKWNIKVAFRFMQLVIIYSLT